jgi:putative ubiquitin-RnfH superfamily antitoxin RatB of RatAB toxin-antitoxin module
MSEFEVEVVFALPLKQSLQIVLVEAGTTVADVIAKSELSVAFPDHNLAEMATGLWGREVELNQVVKEGDRIEIYRPLKLDPREARRQLALSGRTMSDPDSS